MFFHKWKNSTKKWLNLFVRSLHLQLISLGTILRKKKKNMSYDLTQETHPLVIEKIITNLRDSKVPRLEVLGSRSPVFSSRSCSRRSSSGERGVRSYRSRCSSFRRAGRSCRAGWRAAMHRKVRLRQWSVKHAKTSHYNNSRSLCCTTVCILWPTWLCKNTDTATWTNLQACLRE